MHLTDDQIAEFQQLYAKHCGQQIDKNQAHALGMQIVQLVQTISKPLNDHKYYEISQT